MAHAPAPSRLTRIRRGVVRLPLRGATALLAMLALLAGVTFAGQQAAGAASPVAQSNGTFLSGSALGIPLSDIVSVTPAVATNTGDPQVIDSHPLDVAALNAVDVPLDNGINLLGDNGILHLGVVGQYAEANPDGSSRAASGAVTDTGGIAVGGSDAFPSDATLDLTQLIGTGLSDTLGDVSLSTGALSASATQTVDGTQTGDYQIAGLSLDVTSPLISGLTSGLRTTLAGLQPVVDGLPNLIRALPAVGALATITGVPTLTDIVDQLGDITSLDGSIEANLKTGTISIDVAKVLTAAGLDLNNLDPDTELLPYITAALTSQLLPALTTALTGLTQQLTAAIDGIQVSVLGIAVSPAILAPVLDPVITQLLAPVNTVVSGLGAQVITPLAEALTALVSLQANVQETADGEFTERALKLGLLPNGSPPAAVVNLASATVGPNAGPAAPVVPTATSLDPDHGPSAGGQTVTVTGTDFVPGSTSVTIGGVTIPASEVTVTSPTELTFTTPTHAAGPVTVTVTTPGGTSTPGLDYTYDQAAPVVPTTTALDPDHGPSAGGQTVTVTGTDFVPGSTSVTIGGVTIPASEVTVTSPTELTFTTPAHDPGGVTVTVTTPGGTSTPGLDYTYDQATPAAPTATGLDPDHGPTAGGQTVTVTGTGFVPDSTTVTIGGVTIPASEVTVTSPTELTFTTPAHAAGPVTVTVTTPGGTSSPGLDYTYDQATPAKPTTTALDPDHGPSAGGQTVTVTGTDFVPGSTSVTIGGATIPASEVTVTSPTELTFTTPAHDPGGVTVTVTTPGGTSTPGLDYTYDQAAPVVPTTTALDPDHGPTAGGQTVTVTGTDFVPGSTSVTIGGVTIPASEVTVTSPTELTFTTPAHAAGPVTVTVTTPGGTSSPGLDYTYDQAAAAKPTTSGLDPDHGPTAGGQTVTVTGTDFVPGSTSVTIGGVTIPASEVTVTSPTELTFTTPAHAAGPVTVTVTTPGGTSSPGLDYTYDQATPAAPTATALDPDHGPTAGGQTVTVTGTDFVPGSTSVTIGGKRVPASKVTVPSPTRLRFTTPAHAPGPVQVTVTTNGGTSAPLAYTYDKPKATTPPVITDPTDGSTTADPTPVIRGTGTAGNQITVTENGNTLCTATVRSDSSWTCQPSDALSSGKHRILATETTPSGALSGRSDTVTFSVNAATPSTPSSGGGLAVTGLGIASMVVLALVLAAAGALLVLVGRRREES